jgi:hypothetical protein
MTVGQHLRALLALVATVDTLLHECCYMHKCTLCYDTTSTGRIMPLNVRRCGQEQHWLLIATSRPPAVAADRAALHLTHMLPGLSSLIEVTSVAPLMA